MVELGGPNIKQDTLDHNTYVNKNIYKNLAHRVPLTSCCMRLGATIKKILYMGDTEPFDVSR